MLGPARGGDGVVASPWDSMVCTECYDAHGESAWAPAKRKNSNVIQLHKYGKNGSLTTKTKQ